MQNRLTLPGQAVFRSRRNGEPADAVRIARFAAAVNFPTAGHGSPPYVVRPGAAVDEIAASLRSSQ